MEEIDTLISKDTNEIVDKIVIVNTLKVKDFSEVNKNFISKINLNTKVIKLVSKMDFKVITKNRDLKEITVFVKRDKTAIDDI